MTVWKNVTDSTPIPVSTVKNLPFAQRLAIGKKTEHAFLVLYQNLYDPTAYIQEGLDKGKDIISPKYKILLEIKDQPRAVFCVSVELGRQSPGQGIRNSGITTTQADYYVWYCHRKFMIIKTSKLKELIKDISISQHELHGDIYFMKILNIDLLEANAVKVIPYADN